MTQNFVPFQEIIGELKRLGAVRKTGTLFIVTRENKSGQVMLENGEIVFIYFYNKKGEEALEHLAKLEAGRFRFQEGAVFKKRVPLPPTATIIERLESRQFQTTAQTAVAESGTLETGSPENSSIGDKERQILESCLAEFIGPMATIICEDHLQVAADMQAAISALASEIPNGAQASEFKALVSKKLK